MKVKVTVVLDRDAYGLLGAAAMRNKIVAEPNREGDADRSASGLVQGLVRDNLPWPSDPADFPLPDVARVVRTRPKNDGKAGKAKPAPTTVKTTFYLPVTTVRLLDLHSVLKAKDRGAIIQELVRTKLPRVRLQTYFNRGDLVALDDRRDSAVQASNSEPIAA